MNNNWHIECENDEAGEAFIEWWVVTDGSMSFRCSTEADAEWLLEKLRAL